MSGKCRPSLRAKTLENVKRCNLSETDKDCIEAVFKEFERLKEMAEKMLIDIPKEGNYIEILGHKIDGFDSFESFCEYLKKYAELEETVNRQQEEIEKLELLNASLTDSCDGYIKTVNIYRAEIERLLKECEITRAYIHNNGLEWGFVSHLEFYKNQRAEAVKEAFHKLRIRMGYCDLPNGIVRSHMEHIEKEMEGEV